MKDYGYWSYRYSTSFPQAKYVISLQWSKEHNYIKLNRYAWSYTKCDYFLQHVYIDEEYSKADIQTAKQFYEILIRSYPST